MAAALVTISFSKQNDLRRSVAITEAVKEQQSLMMDSAQVTAAAVPGFILQAMVGVTIACGLLRNLGCGFRPPIMQEVPRVITDPVMELERQAYPELPLSSAF